MFSRIIIRTLVTLWSHWLYIHCFSWKHACYISSICFFYESLFTFYLFVFYHVNTFFVSQLCSFWSNIVTFHIFPFNYIGTLTKSNIINYKEDLERLMSWASLASIMLWLGDGGKGEGREEGGRGVEMVRLVCGEEMVGRLMRDGPVGVNRGEEASLFLAKQRRHFPPKNGFCSFSRHCPHSANKYSYLWWKYEWFPPLHNFPVPIWCILTCCCRLSKFANVLLQTPQENPASPAMLAD